MGYFYWLLARRIKVFSGIKGLESIQFSDHTLDNWWFVSLYQLGLRELESCPEFLLSGMSQTIYIACGQNKSRRTLSLNLTRTQIFQWPYHDFLISSFSIAFLVLRLGAPS